MSELILDNNKVEETTYATSPIDVVLEIIREVSDLLKSGETFNLRFEEFNEGENENCLIIFDTDAGSNSPLFEALRSLQNMFGYDDSLRDNPGILFNSVRGACPDIQEVAEIIKETETEGTITVSNLELSSTELDEILEARPELSNYLGRDESPAHIGDELVLPEGFNDLPDGVFWGTGFTLVILGLMVVSRFKHRGQSSNA